MRFFGVNPKQERVTDSVQPKQPCHWHQLNDSNEPLTNSTTNVLHCSCTKHFAPIISPSFFFDRRHGVSDDKQLQNLVALLCTIDALHCVVAAGAKFILGNMPWSTGSCCPGAAGHGLALGLCTLICVASPRHPLHMNSGR